MFDWATKDYLSKDCRRYRARLEELTDEGMLPRADAELAAHLRACADCRQALEDAQLAGELVRQAGAPAVDSSEALVTRVMASIREEVARRMAPENFWRPLEQLASRFALVAGVALFLLAAYLGKAVIPSYNAAPTAASDQSAAANPLPANPNMPGVSPIMPEPPAQPSSPDEVLMSLVERNNDF